MAQRPGGWQEIEDTCFFLSSRGVTAAEHDAVCRTLLPNLQLPEASAFFTSYKRDAFPGRSSVVHDMQAGNEAVEMMSRSSSLGSEGLISQMVSDAPGETELSFLGWHRRENSRA